MWWYIGKRLLQAIPVLLGATLLIYVMAFASPGDPVAALFGDKPVSEDVRQAIVERYHLDQNVFVQWLYFLKGAVTLDFGTAYSGQPVIDLIARAFPVTLTLAVMALIFEMILGIIAGTISGLRRGGLFDATMLVTSLIVIAVPIFVLGFIFQLLFGVKLGWAPTTVGGDWSIGKLVVPAIVLGLVSFAYILRLTRSSVSDNLSADHVRTARAKGLPETQVVRNHVLRNSLIPVVTFLGVDLGTLMAGAVVTEGIFNVPGIGNLAYQSILRGENPTLVSVITLMVLVYIVASLVVDLLYALLDPRIRYA